MLTIPKDSKLYRREDYYISRNEDAHTNGLPAVQTQRKMQKERATQLNMILKGLIRERMIGCLMNEEVLEKGEDAQTYRQRESPFKRIERTTPMRIPREGSRCANHQRQRSIGSNLGREDYHTSFISAVDVSRQGSITSKKERPISLNLPPLRMSTVSINRSLWKHISVGNKLKKELFVKYIGGKFGEHICNSIIRFFQPAFEGVYFRYNDFVESIAKSNINIQRFIMFQIYDYDSDGVISCEDLFKIMELLGDVTEKETMQAQIYRLTELVGRVGSNPGIAKGQSLLEYLTLNHNLTLSEMNQVLDEQHRPFLESNIKKFTGYEHTFLVTEHNEDIRMLKHRAEEIKINMEKDIFRKRGGLPFDTFAEHPQPIVQKIIEALCGADFQPPL